MTRLPPPEEPAAENDAFLVSFTYDDDAGDGRASAGQHPKAAGSPALKRVHIAREHAKQASQPARGQ